MMRSYRILQLIDSLEAGGAERMAVQYANALATTQLFSALVTTRQEGALKAQLLDQVAYLFLDKKGRLDLRAVWRLRNFIRRHKIDLIQAHSTSFFTAVCVKLLCPKVQIIWHNHYGDSMFLKHRRVLFLKTASVFYKGILAVNVPLKEWALAQLKYTNVLYLPNFVGTCGTTSPVLETILNGTAGRRIVCIANLRPEKNHFLLLQVAQMAQKEYGDWTFHLIGKDFNDAYAKAVKEKIKELKLQQHVFIYGSRNDIAAVLEQSDLAVLTSMSEGLPVSLLEYGFYRKPVVCTNVGQMHTVLEDGANGMLVESDDVPAFFASLAELMDNPEKSLILAENLHNHVQLNYSEKTIIARYLAWVQETIIKA